MERKIKKVLFYTSSPKLFRTTLIGHLYEIAQVYPVVLLSEKLDLDTEKVLQDKKLFPKLEEIVPIHSYWGRNIISIIKTNWYLYKTIKSVVSKHKPDVVISTSDINRLELYLMRMTKKINALNLCLQGGFGGVSTERFALWNRLMNAYLKFPSFLPFSMRLFLVELKKYLGHFLYYWILPLMVGEAPFRGKTSFVLWKGDAGMGDGDYYCVFSEKIRQVCLESRVPAEKLCILSHPLKHKAARKFFETTYLSNLKRQQKTKAKILALMLSSETIGFKRENLALIPERELTKRRIEILSLITKILKDWKIFIKPHPAAIEIPILTSKITQTFESISPQIKVVNPLEPADKYIEMSDVIVGIPPASTTLFTASLQCPEKIILSLDLDKEIFGDVYKDAEGIEYIDNKEKFINILEKIRDGQYQKESPEDKKELGEREFSDTIELLEFLYKKKQNEAN